MQSFSVAQYMASVTEVRCAFQMHSSLTYIVVDNDLHQSIRVPVHKENTDIALYNTPYIRHSDKNSSEPDAWYIQYVSFNLK